jgi:hypothetical protein
VKVRSNHLDAKNGWTGRTSVSVGIPSDFRWISNGHRQKPVIFAKFLVRWTSDGLPMDFRWTYKQKRFKRMLSVQFIISINTSEERLSVTCQIHSFCNLIVGFETCQVELYTYFAYSSSSLSVSPPSSSCIPLAAFLAWRAITFLV